MGRTPGPDLHRVGGRGWNRRDFERLFAPRVMRRLYADELKRLDACAREQQAKGSGDG